LIIKIIFAFAIPDVPEDIREEYDKRAQHERAVAKRETLRKLLVDHTINEHHKSQKSHSVLETNSPKSPTKRFGLLSTIYFFRYQLFHAILYCRSFLSFFTGSPKSKEGLEDKEKNMVKSLVQTASAHGVSENDVVLGLLRKEQEALHDAHLEIQKLRALLALTNNNTKKTK
jgi:hypothetical protein